MHFARRIRIIFVVVPVPRMSLQRRVCAQLARRCTIRGAPRYFPCVMHAAYTLARGEARNHFSVTTAPRGYRREVQARGRRSTLERMRIREGEWNFLSTERSRLNAAIPYGGSKRIGRVRTSGLRIDMRNLLLRRSNVRRAAAIAAARYKRASGRVFPDESKY